MEQDIIVCVLFLVANLLCNLCRITFAAIYGVNSLCCEFKYHIISHQTPNAYLPSLSKNQFAFLVRIVVVELYTTSKWHHICVFMIHLIQHQSKILSSVSQLVVDDVIIQYNNTIQYNTIQYNTMQCNTIQYNTIQHKYNTNTIQIQYNTIQYNAMQYNTIQYNTNTIQIQYRYNTTQYNPTQ